MKSPHRLLPLLGLAAVCLSGCYVESGPMPPDAPPAQGEVVVENPPPPPPAVVEAPPAAPPQAGMVWIAGYNRWDGRAYQWQRGHYERPPRAQARYTAAHWEARGHGKVWVNARWR